MQRSIEAGHHQREAYDPVEMFWVSFVERPRRKPHMRQSNGRGAILRALLAISALLPFLSAPVAAQPPADADVTYFRMGTGSISGTYYPIGQAFVNILSMPPGVPECEEDGRCGVPGLVVVTQSTAGSVANLKMIEEGAIESGLAQADIAEWAYKGQRMFTKPHGSLRAIANLYPESVHVVVARSAKIRSIRDLRGKRVSMDKTVSGTYANAQSILKAYGIDVTQVKASDLDPSRAADQLAAGKLDAFFFVSGYPATAIGDLAAKGLIDLLPIDGNPAKALMKEKGFFVADEIPAGTYEGIGAVKTLTIGAQWFVSAKVPEPLVHDLTAALFNARNRQALDDGHPQLRNVKLETAIRGLTLPLHPGAERFYRSKGLVPAPAPRIVPIPRPRPTT